MIKVIQCWNSRRFWTVGLVLALWFPAAKIFARPNMAGGLSAGGARGHIGGISGARPSFSGASGARPNLGAVRPPQNFSRPSVSNVTLPAARPGLPSIGGAGNRLPPSLSGVQPPQLPSVTRPAPGAGRPSTGITRPSFPGTIDRPTVRPPSLCASGSPRPPLPIPRPMTG